MIDRSASVAPLRKATRSRIRHSEPIRSCSNRSERSEEAHGKLREESKLFGFTEMLRPPRFDFAHRPERSVEGRRTQHDNVRRPVSLISATRH